MLEGNFEVRNKSIKQTKQGKPFISMILIPENDKEKSVDAKIWSDSFEKLKDKFKDGDIIKVVNGKQDSYNNNPQIIINDAVVIEERKWGYNLEESKDLYYSLIDFIESNILNEQVKSITTQTINKYSKYPFFFQAPAAKSHHHNYPGGLLKHTLELCEIALAIKKTNLYPFIGWDIVFGACVLHDLGKVHDYVLENNVIETTEIIKLTGHLVTTSLEIYDSAKTMGLEHSPVFNNLLHAVIAHHGKKEWGSPQEPGTKEAWMVHLIDMMSSKISANTTG